ncbi:site-2 protease family protein [Streptomyces sp. G44]|nr:site-2 protease family protein [Streptomyces sp. G44]
MDESGESGRPQSDGSEGLRPSGTDGPSEPPRPNNAPARPHRPAPPTSPTPRPTAPVTKRSEGAGGRGESSSPEGPGEPSSADGRGEGPGSGAREESATPDDRTERPAPGGHGERTTPGRGAEPPTPSHRAGQPPTGERRPVPTLDEASPEAGQRAEDAETTEVTEGKAPTADAPQQPPARQGVPMAKPPRDGRDQDAPRPTQHPPAPHLGDVHAPHAPQAHRHGTAYTDGDGKGGAAPVKGRKNPGGGLLMGRPFGVPVYVAPSWFLVAALITWVFGGQLDRVLPELGGVRYLVSLFFAVAFYASVLVHELAHTVAALRFKLPVRRIQLQFFGGVSEIEKESETPGREFVLAFVGPLLSLVLAGVFYAGMRAVEPGTVPGVLLAGLMISNLIVAAFNLLPGLPLDGGRMLRAVVWKITGKPMSGTVAAAWVGRALAVSVLIGLPLLNQSGVLGGEPQDLGGMNTVTDALLAAILAAIIWTGAGNSLRMARLREHLPDLRARTLTRRAVPVEAHTPLSEALRRANDAGARALVVVDPDGDPMAVVREAAIVSVPQHRRPWVAVSGLAQDITEGMRISAELTGEELLDTLRATPATEYLVVEDSGEIYGVLSAADVERAFVKAMARPS